MLGVDTTGALDPNTLKADGYGAVFRYLSNSPFKNLVMTSAPYNKELMTYLNNGVAVVCNWESSGHIDDNQTNHPGDAHAQGIEDATRAQAQVSQMGIPGAPIYFSIDFDCSDWAGLTTYFQAVASVIGLARTGVYGGFWVVDHCHGNNLVSYIWQTLAWSTVNGQKYTRHPAANVIQRIGTVYVGGVACDVDEILTPANFGQVGTSGPSGSAPVAPGGIETMAFNDTYTDWDGNKQSVQAWMDTVDHRVALILQQLTGSMDVGKYPGWPASRWNLAPGQTQPSYTLIDYIRGLDQQLSTRYSLVGRPVDEGTNDTFIGQILSLRAELSAAVTELDTKLEALGGTVPIAPGDEPAAKPGDTTTTTVTAVTS